MFFAFLTVVAGWRAGVATKHFLFLSRCSSCPGFGFELRTFGLCSGCLSEFELLFFLAFQLPTCVAHLGVRGISDQGTAPSQKFPSGEVQFWAETHARSMSLVAAPPSSN